MEPGLKSWFSFCNQYSMREVYLPYSVLTPSTDSLEQAIGQWGRPKKQPESKCLFLVPNYSRKIRSVLTPTMQRRDQASNAELVDQVNWRSPSVSREYMQLAFLAGRATKRVCDTWRGQQLVGARVVSRETQLKDTWCVTEFMKQKTSYIIYGEENSETKIRSLKTFWNGPKMSLKHN